LERAGRIDAACSLLPADEHPSVHHRVFQASVWAMTLLATGEEPAAYRWYRRAREINRRYHLSSHYTDALRITFE